MKYIYPACFYREKTGYSVIFPDFACGTCGETIEEAYDMAVDFLYTQIVSALEDGEELPKPSEASKIEYENDFDYEDAFKSLIAVDIKEYEKHLASKNKSVRKNVTIPLWLIEKAEKEHVNYSSILQEALKQHLGL